MATIDLVLIFVYLAALVAIGIYANRKQTGVDDYYVAGRRQGTFSMACLWLASWIGGASIIGGAGKSYEAGITGVWYVAAIAVGLILFALFFARRVKEIGDKHHCLTYPDLIEAHFDSRTRLITTITSAAAFVGFSAGQLAAAGSILHVLTGMDFTTSLMVASGIVVLYTATGGYLAVTWTDWFQFILLLIGIVLIGLPLAIQNGGTPLELAEQLPPSYFELGAWGWPAIGALCISITLSFFVAMDSYPRTFAARSAKSARRGAFLAVAFVLPIAVAATWMGMTTQVLFPGITESNDVLTTFVVEMFPPGLRGMMLVGMLAAVMSSADICILSVSANLTRDVYQRYINPEVTPERMLRLGMYASLLVGGVSTLMAWKMQNVLDIMLLAFTLNSAALILPTIAAVYAWKVDSNTAFWSICLSFGTILCWYVCAAFELAPIFAMEALWPGLFVAVISFFGIRAVRPKPAIVAEQRI